MPKEEIKDFANFINYRCQFTSAELKTLHTILREGEECFGMVEGMMKKVHHSKHSGYGIAVLTDRRFLFYHKSLLGGTTLEEFPIATISSITASKGSVLGSLHVYASNVDEIIIEPCDNNNAARLVKAWQILLDERNLVNAGLAEQAQLNSSGETISDPTSELEKWHSLKERGIISEEEYDLKKKQILNL